MISESRRSRWTEITPLLGYSEEIRKDICTTNAIESLSYSLRKVTRNRLAFPTIDQALGRGVDLTGDPIQSAGAGLDGFLQDF